MEIQQLRYVVAIADSGTFTAAARRCFVAQPSLSQSVKRLEGELGVALFARAGRGVALTAAGEAFVGAARSALRSFDAIVPEVDAVRGLVAGHLDLVALPTLALDPTAPLVGAFRRRHPGVTVRLDHPEGTEDLLRAVRSGDCELGITERPRHHAGLTVVPLARQEVVMAFPPGSAVPETLRPADLAGAPIVTQPVGTSTRALLDDLLARARVEPTIAVETDQREVIIPLVQDGAGVALVPRPVAEAAGDTVEILYFRPALWRELAIVHRSGPLSPAARAFLGELG